MASEDAAAVAAKQLELLKAFAAAEGPAPAIGDELMKVISDIALSGAYVHDWADLIPLLSARVKQVAAEFNAKWPDCPDRPGESCDNLTELLVGVIEDLPSAPFTVQRLCEVLWEPERQYKSTKKLLGSLDRILNVSTTKDKSDVATRVIPPPRPVSKPRDAPSEAPPSLLAAIRDSGGLMADVAVNEEGPAFESMERSPEKAAGGAAGGGGGGGSPGEARSPPAALPLSPRASPTGSGGLPVEDTGLPSPPPSPPKAATAALTGSPTTPAGTEAMSWMAASNAADAESAAGAATPSESAAAESAAPAEGDPATATQGAAIAMEM